MSQYEEVLQMLVNALQETDRAGDTDKKAIPLGISNRHIHLAQSEINTLFGEGYQLTKIKDLLQPGQYACKETVIICGPRGVIEKVRVLGPARSETQVEILAGDCFKLGVRAPVRQSGEIENTPGITIVGPMGSVQLSRGVIVAQRHIHMSPQDAQFHQVKDGEIVTIQLTGPRGGLYDNVVIRVSDKFQLECHLDTEEANAMGLTPKSKIYIQKNN